MQFEKLSKLHHFFLMKPKNLIIIIIILSVNFQIYSQYSFTKKKELFVYNTLSNGIIGGIGAMLHKNNETAGKAFIKGFYKGVLSGGVIYLGKDLISEFSRTNNFSYVWGSKLITYTGFSMLENTVNNQPLFENLYFHIGFLRFDVKPKNKFRIKTRIMPISLGTTLWLLTKYKLDVKYSVFTGIFVFTGEKNSFTIQNKSITKLGLSYSGNNIFINNRYPLFHITKQKIFSHELIHYYQAENYSSLNFVYKNIEKKLIRKKTEEWINKYFYIDYNALTFRLFYSTSYIFFNIKNLNYKKNIFESEAYFFADK